MFSGSATFTIDIGMAAPPPPPLPSIQINGSTSPVTVSAGATISARSEEGRGGKGDWLRVYAVSATTVYEQSAVVDMGFDARWKGFDHSCDGCYCWRV